MRGQAGALTICESVLYLIYSSLVTGIRSPYRNGSKLDCAKKNHGLKSFFFRLENPLAKYNFLSSQMFLLAVTFLKRVAFLHKY